VLDSADRAASDHGFPTVAPDPVTAATPVIEAPAGDDTAAEGGSDGAADEQTREREHAN